jgi:hypothetical protein
VRFGERSRADKEESVVALSGFLSEERGAKWGGSGGRLSGGLKRRGWARARATHGAQAVCSEWQRDSGVARAQAGERPGFDRWAGPSAQCQLQFFFSN